MNCLICMHNTKSFVDEKTDITYYACASCDCIFKSPRYYHTLEVQKERYDLHTNHEEDRGYIAYFQRFVDFISPHIQEVACALDFGCGKSPILAKMLTDTIAPCDYYDPIYHPDIEENKKYNLIVSTEVFEHLDTPKVVFERLVKSLKPKGYLAIQTQFHPNDKEKFLQWYYHHDTTHICFFSLKTFEVLAEMYGCVIVADNSKNMVILQKH